MPHGSTITEEFVILSKRKTGVAVNHARQATFCSSPGDSGSFIINRLGEVCGLLYGEVPGLCGPDNADPRTGRLHVGAGLVSCMTHVLPSLEEKTTCLDQLGRRIHGPAVLELAK